MLEEASGDTEPRPPDAKRILRCPAEGCGKVFRSSPGYRYHLKSHASDPRPHQCRYCMKKFKSANGLKYHLRKSHNFEPVASKIKPPSTSRSEESINGNESESTCDEDCVVPSLPQEELISKQSPQQHQQHETVLRMNNSLSDYKREFKSETDHNPFKRERSVDFKTEIPEENNNRLRLSSYDEDENIRYASQAEETFRYGSHPDSSSFRYGAEGANNRFEEGMRLGSQGYSPKPSYRDYWRDSLRDGYSSRSEFHQRLSAVQDYYLQRSMASQDRYPGVIGYTRNEAPSRFSYPRFDYSMRGYPLNRYEAAKSDGYPLASAFDGRTDFQKPNDKYFRSPSDFSSRDDYNSLKSSEEVPRNPFRTMTAPKTPSDEFVKPTVSRSEYALRQSAAGKDIPLKGDRSNALQNNHHDDRNEKSSAGSRDKTPEEREPKCGLIELKSSQKVDINGNTVLEPPSISKRRSSKPIPPALVIEPPSSSNDEKRDDSNKLVPPEVNRLTEFAEFATSPHSPLVQSPFPLTLTPGLLGAGSTPDWMTKSFTRFFFPDKPPTYLNTSGLSSSRHNQEDDDGEARGPSSSSSLPPSPFIDNVSTPQPFWTTQAWPSPVWHCFIKGCSIKFESRDDDYRRVEELSCSNNSLLNKKSEEANYSVNGLIVTDMQETKDMMSNTKGAKDRVLITFESTTPGQPRLFVKCPVDHPFLVKHRGWSSPCPNEAMARYGIPFRSLQKGDICIQSNQNKDTNANTLSPLVACTEAFSFGSSDSSAASALSAMAKRQEMANERPPPPPPLPPSSLLSTSSVTASSPASDAMSPTTSATFSPADSVPRDVQYSMVMQTGEPSLAKSMNHDENQENHGAQLFPRKPKRKRKVNNLEEKQRRPMNGFMLFAKKMRIELTQKYPGKDNRAISKVLGEQWRELSLTERQEYATKAKVMADERRKINPDCWKRKRKKSKEGEHEVDLDKFKIKTKKSPGPMNPVKSSVLQVA
ncbi:uncharacterized protein LOC135692380 isoform X2 [Rhopilema esculentum]|uniref:uncharacterized protein LOC135692380 isoform X2 n=1 Tax=Rhopilema esculentum TaxID=499914 RepID=UPI0031D2ECE7